ncbi:MAG: ABC transporter ATP-binding protein, partial [Rhizobiales bacterium]|nr:ABC transporter ATP-binding protein [Hyphomicrobiales bacterium]
HDRDFIDRVVTSVIVSECDGRWVEYAGGYSDMLAQKKPVAAVKERAVKVARRKAADAAPRRQRKMSFKDKHALETLPATIEELENNIADLREQMADADLYTRDPDAFQKTAAAMQACELELAEAEHRWLELEMLRDELENS